MASTAGLATLALLPPQVATLRHTAELFFKMMQALLHAAAVNFEFRLARSAAPNPTSQTRQRRTLPGQIGHEVF